MAERLSCTALSVAAVFGAINARAAAPVHVPLSLRVFSLAAPSAAPAISAAAAPSVAFAASVAPKGLGFATRPASPAAPMTAADAAAAPAPAVLPALIRAASAGPAVWNGIFDNAATAADAERPSSISFEALKWTILEIMSQGRVISGAQLRGMARRADERYSPEQVREAVAQLRDEGLLLVHGLSYATDVFDRAYVAATPRLFSRLDSRKDSSAMSERGTRTENLRGTIIEILGDGDTLIGESVERSILKAFPSYSPQEVYDTVSQMEIDGLVNSIGGSLRSLEDFRRTVVSGSPALMKQAAERREAARPLFERNLAGVYKDANGFTVDVRPLAGSPGVYNVRADGAIDGRAQFVDVFFHAASMTVYKRWGSRQSRQVFKFTGSTHEAGIVYYSFEYGGPWAEVHETIRLGIQRGTGSLVALAATTRVARWGLPSGWHSGPLKVTTDEFDLTDLRRVR